MTLLIHSFFLIFVSTYNHIDFIEVFGDLNDALSWSHEKGTLLCANHRLKACAITSPENIVPLHMNVREVFPAFFQGTLVSLIMDNSCEMEDPLCCVREKCAVFKTGKITSRKFYPFGRFLWMGFALTPKGVQGTYTKFFIRK